MLKLMIVDDEYYTCEGLKKAIDWEKYNIEIAAVATDGSEAVEIAQHRNIDIIITDIRMKTMDGLDMSEILRKRGYTGQIVIMSGYQQFDYAKRAIDSGVRKYLVKPIDLKELEDTMALISKELAANCADEPEYNIKQGKSTEIVAEIMQYIDNHFTEEIQLSVFAAKHFRDVTYISRLFKEYTGINYSDYLVEKRVEYAKKLLIKANTSVDDVANAVGYNDTSHFRRVFKSKTGMSPAQYRKENRK